MSHKFPKVVPFVR